MNEQRLDDMEAKIAYQEDAIELLNKAITRQQDMISDLERTCKLLNDRITELQGGAGSAASDQELPPHY